MWKHKFKNHTLNCPPLDNFPVMRVLSVPKEPKINVLLSCLTSTLQNITITKNSQHHRGHCTKNVELLKDTSSLNFFILLLQKREVGVEGKICYLLVTCGGENSLWKMLMNSALLFMNSILLSMEKLEQPRPTGFKTSAST